MVKEYSVDKAIIIALDSVITARGISWVDIKIEGNDVKVGHYRNWGSVKKFITDCLTKQLTPKTQQ